MRHFGEVDGVPVMLTDHALARMVEMGVTPEDFKNLITDPEERYSSRKYPGTTCHQWGKYSLAFQMEGRVMVVVTLLYASLEDWCEAAKNGKLGSRGKLRADIGIRRRRQR